MICGEMYESGPNYRSADQKAFWLSNWMIHHANHIPPNIDGVKVGGYQASSASMAAIIAALYFGVLKSEDRIAVKPHASRCSTPFNICSASRA